MARSGNYEVDDEGNIVEVGEGPAEAGAGEPVAATTDAKEPDPIPVRRAMFVYTIAQLISFTILLVMAAAMPDIRVLLLLFAAAYLVIAFVLHRIYRRALLRSFGRRAGTKSSAGDGA